MLKYIQIQTLFYKKKVVSKKVKLKYIWIKNQVTNKLTKIWLKNTFWKFYGVISMIV